MNVFDVELVSGRIKLRRIRVDDLSDLYEFTSRKSITEYLEWSAHINPSETRNFIDRILRDYEINTSSFLWGIEYLENSKLVGTCRIYDYSASYGRAEISYVINPDYQGKGLMYEALRKIYEFCFNQLRLVRIQAKCSTKNIGSIRLLEKSGMKKEGCLRKLYKAHGELHDSFIFSIITDEYISESDK